MIRNRYHIAVVFPYEGLIDTAATKGEAFKIAHEESKHTGRQDQRVSVFDSMAKVGAQDRWEYKRGRCMLIECRLPHPIGGRYV